MDAYTIGNILGRLLVSYLLAWVFMWLALSRRNWRVAFRSTHRWYGITLAAVIFAMGMLSGASIANASSTEPKRVLRPMHIHRIAELGLEIWTEADPEWETRRLVVNGRSVFSAETPALTYPPAGMTWVSVPDIEFAPEEIEAGARGAIHRAAHNYGVHDPTTLILEPASYGDISGYETRFLASAQDTPVDVLIFFGHKPGKPAVLAHAYTLRGKLDHISENIRRSWTHLRYLE